MRKKNHIISQKSQQDLADIFNLGTCDGKGRLISLLDTSLTAMLNVFISGVFYTSFLSMYGISITGVGIVSFIPFIANCFSIFAPFLLERFPKRKGIVLTAKVIYYALYILATTVMPQFVIDPDARLIWFAGILFAAHLINTIYSPGITSWFFQFYPKNNERRARFIAFSQIFPSIISSGMLGLCSIVVDNAAGSPMESKLILGFRYFAFFLVLVDVAIQACAKEYPYARTPRLQLRHVFTLSLKHRKFLLCSILMFVWSFNQNLNAGLWNYHLLNHLHYSYAVISAATVCYTVMLLLTCRLWRNVLRRYSWIKTFSIACLLFVPTEFIMFRLTPGTEVCYLLTVIFQNIMSVGLNLAYGNILYMNLPKEKSTVHISFNTFGCNLFSFLGMLTGTWVSSLSGDSTWDIPGMSIYTVQLTTVIRGVLMLAIGCILLHYWRSFTPDNDIAEVEAIRTRHL